MPRILPLSAALQPSGQPAADAPLPALLTQGRDRKRAEAIHRVQVGLAGLCAMVLMVALASVILERAQLTDVVTVPETTNTAPPQIPAPGNDPLAEAGVVPDMPAQAAPAPEQEQAIVPERGNAPREQ